MFQVINLANQGLPAKSMVFTKNGKELWAASGNCIAIIDIETLSVAEQIKVFALHRWLISHLVTDGTRVWSIDRKSSIIYQWDVETRRKCYKFDCDIQNAAGLVIGEPLGLTGNSKMSDEEMKEVQEIIGSSKNNSDIKDSREQSRDMPVISEEQDEQSSDDNLGVFRTDRGIGKPSNSENGSTNSVPAQSDTGSQEDIDNIGSTDESPEMKPLKSNYFGEEKPRQRPVNILKVSPYLARIAKKTQPSLMFARKKLVVRAKRARKWRTAETEDLPVQSRPRSGALTNTAMRLTSILLVGDTLWIGRASGDVLVLNVRSPGSVTSKRLQDGNQIVFGEVLAQLTDEMAKQPHYLKEVSSVIRVGRHRIVSVVRVESKADYMRQLSERLEDDRAPRKGSLDRPLDHFRLLTFEAWTSKQFANFFKQIQGLHSLEEER